MFASEVKEKNYNSKSLTQWPTELLLSSTLKRKEREKILKQLLFLEYEYQILKTKFGLCCITAYPILNTPFHFCYNQLIYEVTMNF